MQELVESFSYACTVAGATWTLLIAAGSEVAPHVLHFLCRHIIASASGPQCLVPSSPLKPPLALLRRVLQEYEPGAKPRDLLFASESSDAGDEGWCEVALEVHPRAADIAPGLLCLAHLMHALHNHQSAA